MLLIDAGNTRIKAAYAGCFGQSWFVLREAATGEQLKRKVSHLLDLAKQPPRRVVLSCVADSDLAEMIIERCKNLWGVSVEQLRSGTNFGQLQNGYLAPALLGVDRWAAIVAGWMRARTSVIVVGCGTAVTIDTVLESGMHQGGVILPGVQMSKENFYQRTGNVERGGIREVQIFARNTSSAVASGAFWSVVGGIQAVVERISQNLSSTPIILLSGGDAAEIYPFLSKALGEQSPIQVRLVDHLVFEGMQFLAGE